MKKIRFNICFFEKNAYLTTSILEIMTFFDGDTNNFETLPQIFSFFFQPQNEFCRQTNTFRKNFFRMEHLSFRLQNVVLGPITLAFFLST